jgi:hypothetical protein
MSLKVSHGLTKDGKNVIPKSGELEEYINLKLAAMGQPVIDGLKGSKIFGLANGLIKNHKAMNRLLSDYLCPADKRIQDFLDGYLSEYKDSVNIRLPYNTFILDRHGLARMMSLPSGRDEYASDIIRSNRIKQGVLHNPKNDRRTTKGVFHVVEGGLPIAGDKKAVPKQVFAKLLEAALNPPADLLQLPYTSGQDNKAELFVSLLLRPIVSPPVQGVSEKKSMEIRFFTPGSLISNLDFVESIFGNAGDPFLAENDAGLETHGWSGHTGCVILAPHLVKLNKKELGLPNKEDATDRQKRDGMCWEDENEFYNDGGAFKITARTEEGTIVTVIADNYFGYSKKEVKTQIGFAANLLGNVEEEHSGGAIAYPSYSLGDSFLDDKIIDTNNLTFDEMINMYSSFMDVHDEGYAVDRKYPEIIYVSEKAEFDLIAQKVKWQNNGEEKSIALHPSNLYMLPSGYKIRMEKNPFIPSWRLVGTVAEGTFCHKPSTVSGGGKSEISKSITDAVLYGAFYVADFEKDFQMVEEIINKDYSRRYKVIYEDAGTSRPVLSPSRSLGSVIKLFTPSPTRYSDEYNEWLAGIPHYIKGLVYIVKRFYKPGWGDNWKEKFSVDVIDGKPGHELKYNGRKLVAIYLRVGLQNDNSWRTFKLRQDFIAADKVQTEDDITASIVIPSEKLGNLNSHYSNSAVKFVENCEYRFFQRPDEAIHKGYDKQAEIDLSSANTFVSNFEPLSVDDVEKIFKNAIEFDKYTAPMKEHIKSFVKGEEGSYAVVSSHPRMVDGKPSKNMRYLQNRPDLSKHREKYLAEVGTRLFRKVPAGEPVFMPVNAVLGGRRNNPPETNVRPLAVYNPIHYQELPELFMDFICSLTGKSPSTTGAGSEGALTKGPFNALQPIIDLNNALVSFILTGYDGYTTAAGFIGPNYEVGHDVSLLVPEIWSRIRPEEREHKFLIDHGYLEKLEDFEHDGEKILASRLGYRITSKFASVFLGRVFENPDAVFNEEMLKPELQSMDVFADGIKNIT